MQWQHLNTFVPSNDARIRTCGHLACKRVRTPAAGNGQARRGPATALNEALTYLRLVDPEQAQQFARRLEHRLPFLTFVPGAPEQRQYSQFPAAARDEMTAAIGALVTLLDEKRVAYLGTTSLTDYDWALRNARAAVQVDKWLRTIPVGWTRADGIAWLSEAMDLRGQAMANNIRAIQEELGEDARILVFASRFHLSAAPVHVAQFGVERENVTAGVHLRRLYGANMVTIGHLVGKGATGCGDIRHRPIVEGASDSVDRTVSTLGIPRFWIDLRSAPPDVRVWLRWPRTLWDGSSTLRTNLAEAFDVLYFIDRISPACPSAM